jgi:hypothetical protein
MEWFPLSVAAFLLHLIFPVIAKIIFCCENWFFFRVPGLEVILSPISAHHYIHQTVLGVFPSLNMMTQTFYLDRVVQTRTPCLEYLILYWTKQNICPKKKLILATLHSAFIKITFKSLQSHTNALFSIFTTFCTPWLLNKYCTVYLLFHFYHIKMGRGPA